MDVKGKKSHLVLDICKHLNADALIANSGSENSLKKDKPIFDNSDIKVSHHNYNHTEYNHTEYNQRRDIFFKDLYKVDLLFLKGNNSKYFI
jgi:hypothetical protein